MKRSNTLFVLGALACTAAAIKSKGQVSPWPLPKTRHGNNRIVGGSFASEKFLKGTALVMLYDQDFDSYLYVENCTLHFDSFLIFLLTYLIPSGTCTGSILGNKWILSAAHCFMDYDGLPWGNGWAKFGVIPATKWATVEDAVESGIFIKNMYIHNKFSGFDFRYDIALLELEKEIRPTKFTKVEFTTPPADKVKIKAVGYGALNDAGVSARRCRMVDVVYRSFDWCFEKEPYPSEYYSPNHQICAVSTGWPSGNTDTCYGDSGGPLYKKGTENKLYQIGITSFSNSGCAAYGGIPWYVKTIGFRENIMNIMKNESDPDFDSYLADRTNFRAWNEANNGEIIDEPEPSVGPQ